MQWVLTGTSSSTVLLRSFHRLRLSFHTGNRSSESQFPGFPEAAAVPSCSSEIWETLWWFSESFQGMSYGVCEKRKPKITKKEPSRGPGLHICSQFPGTSPSCRCSSPSLAQVTSDLDGLCVYSCILRRYVSAAISSAPKVTCLGFVLLFIF